MPGRGSGPAGRTRFCVTSAPNAAGPLAKFPLYMSTPIKASTHTQRIRDVGRPRDRVPISAAL
ncbi:hypothetical protein CBM2633_B11077 [Cupriavidus taiwanensis]|nr:hypothetical protein CBM2633_B11077 [Cupriavidus taiwanensis]